MKGKKMKGKFSTRRLGASVLAVAMVAVLVLTIIPAEAFAKTADLDTSTKYTESLGDNASTEYAGRVWTDKSVYEESATFATYGGGSVTVNVNEEGVDDEDFLVAYSALATSTSVQGQHQAPVDVVLILDISGSMSNQDSNMDNKKSRIYNTVQAANKAIDDLMALNSYTRVSVVAFSSDAQILLPLDRYSKITTKEWQEIDGRWQQVTVELPYFSLSRDTASPEYAVLYTNAKGSNGNVRKSTDVEGGTNIQMGLYEGMKVLADEESVTAVINGEEVQRVPSVILLSDGSPTFSSDSTAWWAPEDNDNDGPGSAPYAGNGMKAILVGSYMKDAIDRNYKVGGTAMATTVYTVGMGITGLTDDEKNLAYITLDPGTYWNDSSVVNSMKTTIKSYWSEYTKSNNTGTLDINVGKQELRNNRWVYTDDYYELTHPDTGYDVDPDTGYDYVNAYYKADSASAVTDVFEQLVSNISIAAPQVPTEIKGDDPVKDGYITYTDPVGQYMEVKDVKSIIYAGTEFTQKSVSVEDGVTTYTFEGTVDSAVYGHQEIDNIVITVTKVADGSETLVIKIPASVIPLRVNEVTLNEDGTVKTHTNNGAFPARVVYTVGLQDGIKKVDDEGNEYIDTTKLSADYIAANINEDGGINFYSNLYTNSKTVNGSTVGDATVEFEAAHTNSFYYIQEDMPIYKDSKFKEQVTSEEGVDDDTVYYYKDVYYHGVSVEVDAIERTGKQLKQTEIKTGEDGYLYRAAGSPRLNRMLKFEGTKTKNATGTAEDFYAPTFQHAEGSADPYEGKIVVYLGNNGLLSLPAGGNLEISKTVNAASGLTAPDKEFVFTLDLNGSDIHEGAYNYTIVNEDNEQIGKGTVSKTKPTIILKDGQTAKIYSLPPGTTYTVTETGADGFSAESSGDRGTITAGTTCTAVFTNTYNVTSTELSGVLTGEKELKGREWTDKDSFTFFINPYNNAPLPADYDADTGVTVSAPDTEGGQTAGFDFGTIEFNAPGVYRYTIVEKEPENDEYLPGMTYSRALYRLVVTVVDNGDGTMDVASYDIQKLYTDNAGTLFTYDEDGQIVMNQGQEEQDAIKFVNTYSAEAVTRVPVALKDYTDNSGMNPLVSGMFQFKLEAVGVVENGEVVADSVSVVPMPEGSENGAIVTTNEGHNVTFPHVTFTQNMIPDGDKTITFRYQMSEVTPDPAVNGMVYDKNAHIIDVVVSVDPTSDILDVEAIYPNNERIVTFVNEYTQVPVTVDVKGSKMLTGRDMKADDEFTFNIYGADAATNLAVRNGIVVIPDSSAEVAGGKDGEAKGFAFEDIQFKKAGTYSFTVTEEAGTAPAVTYDDSAITVTVVVDDVDKDGNLEITSITYSNGKDAAEFTNTYTTEFDGSPVSLEGTKNLTGKTLLSGEFFFNVDEYFNGHKVSSNLVSHTSDTEVTDGVYTGTVEFLKDKTYSEAGTYEYYITEQIPNPKVGGTAYDESEYRFTVIVEDKDKEGKLTVKSTKLEKKNDKNGWESVDGIVFNNVYEPEPTTAVAPLAKKVIGGDRSVALKAGEFDFAISVISADSEDGIVLPDDKTASNAADGSIRFDDITFTKAGIYSVKISEIIPEDANKVPGITYTDNEIVATYRVVDDRNGTLTASLVSTTGGATFVNEYEAQAAEVDVEIHKNFTGRENNEWLSIDKFDFEVVILDPATRQAVEDGDIEFPTDVSGGITTKTIYAAGETITGNVKIHKAGTYKFIVREVSNNPIDGVTYDSQPREITIAATDNSAAATIDTKVTIKIGDADPVEGQKNAKGAYELTFTNVYDTESTEISGHDNLVVTKKFTGRENDEWLDTDAFDFKLAAGNEDTAAAITRGDVEMPSSTTLTVTNANKAHAHFGNITFHKEGVYEFTVTELIPEDKIPGVTYDNKGARKVVVEVTDNGIGGLVAELAADSDDLTFENSYSADEVVLSGEANLKITKALSGREWSANDRFTFSIRPFGEVTNDAITAGTVVMPDSTSLSITPGTDLTVSNVEGAFGNITFKAAGDYRFVITESGTDNNGLIYDNHECYVTVAVTDDTEGKLVTDVNYKGSRIFVNEYKADSALVNLTVDKKLTGRDWFDTDKFTFTLTPADDTAQAVADGIVKLDKEEVAVTKASADKTAHFGDIKFEKPGTYNFIIEEKAGNIDGVTYDTHKAEVSVTVTDNLDGTMSAVAVPVTEGSMTFNNVYTPAPVTVDMEGTKKLTGRALTDDEFAFEIKAVTEGAPMPSAGTTVKNTADLENRHVGNVDFGTITYTEAGTYKYQITETKGDLAGVTYDGSKIGVTVNVAYNKATGLLNADVSYDGTNDSNGFVFNNEYSAKPVSISLGADKKVIASEGNAYDLKAGDFKFELTPADSNPDSDPVEDAIAVENDADGNISLGTLQFREAGEYTYTLKELSSGIAGISYDDTVYTITVKVTDNEGNAQLEAVTSITKAGNEVDAMVFENGYDPEETAVNFDGMKVLESGHKALEADTFTFQLKDADGKVIDTATNSAAGTFQFDSITYDREGTFEYTVSEVNDGKAGYIYDNAVYRIVVVVTDEDGALKADITGGTAEDIVFTNGYEPAPAALIVKGHKALTGRDLAAGEFQFAIMDGEKEIVSAVNSADGSFTFGALKFTEAGTYNYTIEEKNTGAAGITYDQVVYGVTIKVVDESGALKVESADYIQNGESVDSIAFSNTYAPAPTSIQLGAAKVLEGRELAEGEFKFVLEDKDGNRMYAENAADGKIIFDEINYDAAGTYTYKLYEESGDEKNMIYDETVYNITVTVKDDLTGNLKAEIEGLDDGAVFKNFYSPEEPPTNPKEPTPPTEPTKPMDETSDGGTQTGDDFNAGLYGLLALAALAVAVAAVGRRKEVK